MQVSHLVRVGVGARVSARARFRALVRVGARARVGVGVRAMVRVRVRVSVRASHLWKARCRGDIGRYRGDLGRSAHLWKVRPWLGPSFLTVNGPEAGVPHLVRVRIRVGARVRVRSGTVVRVRARFGSGLLALLGSASG